MLFPVHFWTFILLNKLFHSVVYSATVMANFISQLFPINFPSAFILRLCVISGHIKTFYDLLDIVSSNIC